jgi:L-aminopeptidase/D-esterase-like protein
MGGNARATKGGIGTAAIELDNGLIVAALCAVNAFGDVVDEQGNIFAGLRTEDDSDFASVQEMLRRFRRPPPLATSNTVIGVVATNARLSKEQANKVAQMAHDGLARAVRPAHTMFDGDTIFALATGEVEGDVNVVGAYGADVFEQAIRNGVRAATTLAGVRAWDNLPGAVSG